VQNNRPSGRRRRRAVRLSAASLLLAFQFLSLAPLLLDSDPVDGSGLSSLTRRDPKGADRGQEPARDKVCIARKAAPELVAAGERRSPASPERRSPVVLEPEPAAAAPRGNVGAVLTNPTYLQIFLPANPHSLRAPPARI
jgi:hypothetical protein